MGKEEKKQQASHPHYRPIQTPTTGLTPNPSPRGEGSNMLCFYSLAL